MIKVSNLHKYFNKGRSNELHVINDVSLELPDKGFITILGKSGSGKTTLLNVLGGLDDFYSGSITYEEEKFTHYKMGSIDKYRSKNIGYIFQNYLVMPDETVFENVDTSLKLAGIQDKKERKKRANEALNAVGMSKYRRKAANSLSGGQKQRIGIARAIAKLPKIIIADEPTGNLDSENSVDIMRILKDISSKYLIIMVTHNETLAKAFSDRIIHYKDGQIIEDEINIPDESLYGKLKGRHDKIYLSDYKLQESKADGINAKVYSKDKKKVNLNLQVIERDGKKYLFVDDDVIVNDKNVDILETRPVVKEDVEEEKVSSFDLSSFEETPRKHVPFYILLKQAFFSFFNEGKLKTTAYKILSGLMGVGISVVSLLTYYTFYTVDYSKALDTIELSSLSVSKIEINAGQWDPLLKSDAIRALDNYEESGVKGIVTSVFVDSDSFGLGKLTGVSQSYASAYIHNPSVNGDIPRVTWGKQPEKEDEIAISSGLINLAMPQYTARGYKYESLLNKPFYKHDGTRIKSNAVDFTPNVVGIVNTNVPIIYTTKANEYAVTDGLLSSAEHTFSLLDKITFKSVSTYGEMGTITDINPVNSNKINVYISSGAQNYFNNRFASDYSLFNVVGSFENNEVFAVLLENDLDSDNHNSVYRYKTNAGSMSFDFLAYSSDIPANIELVDGRLPNKIGEYLVSETNEFIPEGEDSLLNIVGHYKASNDNLNFGKIYTVFSNVYASKVYDGIKSLAADYLGNISNTYIKSYPYALYSDDFAKSISFINGRYPSSTHYVFKSTLDAINEANTANLTNNQNIIMISVSAAVLVLMLVLVLISTRSNMIRHIYSISVFRSLGTTRGDVYRIFISKDLISYLFTIFLGVLATFITSWIITGVLGIYGVPFWVFLLVVAATYGISLLGTMIPLWGLLGKTPNKIATKYDI